MDRKEIDDVIFENQLYVFGRQDDCRRHRIRIPLRTGRASAEDCLKTGLNIVASSGHLSGEI